MTSAGSYSQRDLISIVARANRAVVRILCWIVIWSTVTFGGAAVALADPPEVKAIPVPLKLGAIRVFQLGKNAVIATNSHPCYCRASIIGTEHTARGVMVQGCRAGSSYVIVADGDGVTSYLFSVEP